MTIGEGTGLHDLAKCGAKKRQGPGFCEKPAGWGTSHVGEGRCRLHGGATRTQSSGAVRALARREAADAVRRLGFEPVENPYRELQRLAGELVAVKDWLRGGVERLEAVRYQGGSGEQIRGELSAYQAALRDTASVLATMARLRIDERLVELSEAQARLVVAAFTAGLRAAGISGDQAILARREVARQLRLLPAEEREEAGW
ncbi:hypothetical protein ACIRVK_13690 [Streptomyces sp. NPDC101152]|uniref:hypothetical protein n=1 Tax=Streptomyces sp. NPDC101152 TaxID=3366116 RepID=UPI003804D4C2